MSDENGAGTSKENAEPTGGPQSSAQRSGPDQAAQEAGGATPARAGESEQSVDPLGSETSPEGGTRQAPTRARRGMFNVRGSGDTSGFGGLQLPGYVPAPAERPYGGWFVAFVVDDAHVPSIVEVYPTADWHERETWDMFGIVFDGHPALTRILMPDDWDGHPQRKDYPLGGVPDEHHVQPGRPLRRLPRDDRGPRLHRHRWRLGPDAGHRGLRRGTPRREHGPAAPLHPRRPAAGARPRG